MTECGSVSPQEHHSGATCNRLLGHEDYHAEVDYYGSMRFWTERDLAQARVQELETAFPALVRTAYEAEDSFGPDARNTIMTGLEELEDARDRVPPG